MTASLLGIDLGTSSVKVLLVDETGNVIGSGSAAYPIHHPQPGMAEQDPRDWQTAVGIAVRQAVRAGSAGGIQAIGLSSQMHGTLLLDSQERLLCPAVIWPDQRSAPQVEEITRLIGAERLIKITGSPLATGFQAATLRWFQQEQPELWEQVEKILLPKDYLRGWLTGEWASEPSDGSGSLLLDVRTRQWSPSILETLHIDGQKLPPIQPSTALAGRLQPDVAAELSLQPGIPVVAGSADQAASLLGVGATGSQTLLANLSTGGQLVLPIRQVAIDRAGRMHTFCSALEPGEGRAAWYKLGATLAAGQSLRWLRERVFGLEGDDAYARMTGWAEESPVGSRGLVFLPYLTGERTPLMDPQARGLYLGLTLQHGRAELVRALMEGVTFSLYEAYQVIIESGEKPQRIILAGGGARSPLWRRMVTDVFALPVQHLQLTEGSALGATMLAGAGIGLFEATSASQEWARYDPPIEPNLHTHARYLELLEIFRSAYRQNLLDFHRLDELWSG
jgi:xylulokinase